MGATSSKEDEQSLQVDQAESRPEKHAKRASKVDRSHEQVAKMANITSPHDITMQATSPEQEESPIATKKSKKGEKKVKKAGKKGKKSLETEAASKSPTEKSAEQVNGQLHEDNFANLLLRDGKESADSDAALAAQALASSALIGRLEEPFASSGARVAQMGGFPDQSNIDPTLRGPEETEEDMQNRLAMLQAWQAQAPQQATESTFTQGAPQVPIMGLQGDFIAYDPVVSNEHLASLAMSAEEATTSQMEPPPSKPKGKGGRKKKVTTADETVVVEKKSKKRKRASSNETEEDDQAVPTKQTKKRKAAAPTTDQDDAELSEGSLPTAGPFIKPEIARIEHIVTLFRKNNDMTEVELNDLVQNKSREKLENREMFWAELYEALPHRQHVAIQRTARRRYHNFEARGKWTPEEDATLRQAYETQPQKWVAIGNILGRMPEDCRDRWRNYLACGDTKRTEDWTQKEENELTMIVQHLVSEIRKAAKETATTKKVAFREQDWEKEVNFNIVSKEMKHTRSRLQCYQHWRIMQAREAREEEGIGRSGAATRDRAEGAPPKNEWRRRQAEENCTKMSISDKIKIIDAVANSETIEDDMIPWRLLKKKDPDQVWSTMDRKVAYQQLKRCVPRQSNLVATCEAIMHYLDQWQYTGVQPPVPDTDDLPEYMASENDLDDNDGPTEMMADAEGPQSSKKSIRESSNKWQRRAKLSDEMIVDSDEEDGNVDGTIQAHGNEDASIYQSAVSGGKADAVAEVADEGLKKNGKKMKKQKHKVQQAAVATMT